MFTPENELERALVAASTDPVARPQFYVVFVASEIFVSNYGPAVSAQEEQGMLKAGAELAFHPLQHDGREMLPIFSSLRRLQNFIPEDAHYLAMKTMDFLKLTQGATLILNPGSEYGKELTPSEVASILDGSLWQPIKTFVAEKELTVQLGQPARYPHALTDALSRLFKDLKNVEAAYLTHFYNPAQGDPPHTLIGIQATGNWNDIAGRAGIVLAGVEVPDPPVDFLHMSGMEGLEEYLLTTKPFYKRKAFGLF